MKQMLRKLPRNCNLLVFSLINQGQWKEENLYSLLLAEVICSPVLSLPQRRNFLFFRLSESGLVKENLVMGLYRSKRKGHTFLGGETFFKIHRAVQKVGQKET